MITRSARKSRKISSWEAGLGRFDFRDAEEKLSGGELSTQQIKTAFPKAIARGVELLDEVESLRRERESLNGSLDDALGLVAELEAEVASLKHERVLAAKRQGTLNHCGCHRDKYAPSPETEEVLPSDETSDSPYEEIDARYAAQVEAEEADTWSEARAQAEEYRDIDQEVWEDFASSL